MPITSYHAKYFAYELTRQYSSDNMQKLAALLSYAQLDLNPHQVEARLKQNIETTELFLVKWTIV